MTNNIKFLCRFLPQLGNGERCIEPCHKNEAKGTAPKKSSTPSRTGQFQEVGSPIFHDKKSIKYIKWFSHP